jgi:hypothetical protein
MLRRQLSDSERTRLRLYCTYLYLLVACEPATRGYDPVEFEPKRLWFYRQLADGLAQV